MTLPYHHYARTIEARQRTCACWAQALTRAGAHTFCLPLYREWKHGHELRAVVGRYELLVPMRPRAHGFFLHWYGHVDFPISFLRQLSPKLHPRVLNTFYVDHDAALADALAGINILSTYLTTMTQLTTDAAIEEF
jgi:hypothetical protein